MFSEVPDVFEDARVDAPDDVIRPAIPVDARPEIILIPRRSFEKRLPVRQGS